jgi:hypothetical protein
MGSSTLLAKIDIKDAFRLLRIHLNDQLYLGIWFSGFYFYERCIPFGIHPGPSLFEEFATAVERICNAEGIPRIPHYADDSLLITTPTEASQHYKKALSIMHSLGIPLSEDKLIPPSPVVEFLGIVIDCPAMQIRIPEDKLTVYRSDIAAALSHPTELTLHDAQSLIGILIYSSRCVQKGRLFVSHLLRDLSHFDPSHSHLTASEGVPYEPHSHLTASERLSRPLRPTETISGGPFPSPLAETIGRALTPTPFAETIGKALTPTSHAETIGMDVSPQPLAETIGRALSPQSLAETIGRDLSSPLLAKTIGRKGKLPADSNRRGPQRDSHDLSLSQGSLMELRWWDKCLKEWNGVNIIPPSINFVPLSQRNSLFTDACDTGMGAWLLKANGSAHFLLHRWTDREISLATRKTRISMPFLEMLSVIRSVYTWRYDLADSAINLRTDCSAVVSAINSDYSPTLQSHQLLLSLFLTTTTHRIFIDCQHIEGILNVEADALSRAPPPSNTHPYDSYLSDHFFSLPSVSSVHSHLLSQTPIVDLPSEHLGPVWNAFATPPWRPPLIGPMNTESRDL